MSWQKSAALRQDSSLYIVSKNLNSEIFCVRLCVNHFGERIQWKDILNVLSAEALE